MYSRGANLIPMDQFEGRMNTQALYQLIDNAVQANMNTLRVWGGGIFLPSVFYEECDRRGVILYHDMMYAQGHIPRNNSVVQERELRHQIRRLSHHPCIVLYDGCNECVVDLTKSTGVYASFVLRVVVEEDDSRYVGGCALVWPCGRLLCVYVYIECLSAYSFIQSVFGLFSMLYV